MTVRPFPFIVGCGRSGTTLVRALLDSHPDLAIPGESYFPVWLAKSRARYESTAFDVGRFVDDLLRHSWFLRWGIPAEVVRAGYAAAAPSDYADAVRVAYALYASEHGKSRYGDKTPMFVQHIDLLARLFPESIFVHVIRDGRDVGLSLLQADWGPRSVGTSALQWKLHVRSGQRAGAHLGPARYLEVKYEDLLDDPESAVRRLCNFTQLSYDTRMLHYFERAPGLLAGLPDPEEHQNLRLPPTKGLRDWRSQMTTFDEAVFEGLAGDLLGELGYERVFPRRSLQTSGRAGQEWVRWRITRGGRALRSSTAGLLRNRETRS